MPKRAALPPGLIVRTGKFVWNTMWHAMMSQMAPRNQKGDYVRPESSFRGREILPEAGRYRLIVGMSCPWAHRTLVTRALKGLEDAIALTIVYPSTDEGRWLFDTTQTDLPFTDCRSLPDFYSEASPGYKGRATVPVLWDSIANTIVNNESAEIIELLNSEFGKLATGPDLYPAVLKADIDSLNQKIYTNVNNGVYKCGFAQTQSAYDQAVTNLFATLDELDEILATNRYLCGDTLTLADVRLFTTLIRFDVAYHGIFKCNRRRISDYAHLNGYLAEIYQMPGIAQTCDIDAVKRDYFGNLFPLNPGGIVPIGPGWDNLKQPHGRALTA
ncbi:Glutathione S-transferase, C-terminal domain protein [Synechococcus sp. PCC 7335]|uniref:glutathione S-transferase family protein n=1 Tax=Synechococcus sp. (strain ATCC 29403 / PCC 7335) TaxID=91464 RepID=UPI00017EBC26|nr:glutathione S-transferase C-terminal domain-containing protein [Synechococcus sp. PCC 7335]EDX86562.1 Glutathione S-transferase, C-terminal domain protein [Synechococcus sp. PCC 7335]